MSTRTQLPAHDWDLTHTPGKDERWPEIRAWLRSLGLSDITIRKYRLDRYMYMDHDCWECMVREALRSHGTLTEEQYRRKRVQMERENSNGHR